MTNALTRLITLILPLLFVDGQMMLLHAFPLVALLLAPFAALHAADATPQAKPNIVFFLIDDCSTHEFGCYGNKINPTPNIDRLAESGLRFNTAWGTPLCIPSRALLLNGQYGFKTGIYDNGVVAAKRGELPNRRSSRCPRLCSRQATRPSWAASDTGRDCPATPLGVLTSMCFTGPSAEAASGNQAWRARYQGPWWPWPGANREVRAQPEGRCHPYATWHPMIIRNGEYVETGPKDFGPDILSDAVADYIRRKAQEQKPFFIYYAEHLTHQPHTSMHDPEAADRETAPGMESNVRYVDFVIGQLVKTLKGTGVWDNTVLIVSGDNPSDTLGKGFAAAIGAHVPLIVGGGEEWVTWQGETGCLTDFADVYPTCMELAGLDPATNRELSGKSFKSLLDGNKAYTRPWIFSYLGIYRMVRDRQWCLDGLDQLWRCNDSGNPYTFELITNEKEDAEAAQGRAGLEAILTDLPAVPEEIIDATPQFAADRDANRAGDLSPLQRFHILYRMGLDKLMALPARKEGPTCAQIAARLETHSTQTPPASTLAQQAERNTTNATPNPVDDAGETVTDIDGNVYQTVRIGSQIWMKENLNTKRLNDGTPISPVNDEAQWRAATVSAYCVYSNSHEGLIANFEHDYGLLYNGHTVISGKLAPAGWHVPTQADWDTLIAHLGGLGVAGGRMKESGTDHWKAPNHLADNVSGFSARAAGFRHHNGACDDLGTMARFWTATSSGHGLTAAESISTSSRKMSTRCAAWNFNRSPPCFTSAPG